MSGRVVNVPQHQASYNSSKAAVDQLAKSLAVEWAPAIRVNAIAPGYFLSDMTRQFTEANPDLAADWVSRIPAGRMGEPAGRASGQEQLLLLQLEQEQLQQLPRAPEHARQF